MGTRNKKPRNKFLESPTYIAMLQALFLEAVFIPKRYQIKDQVHLQSVVTHYCYDSSEAMMMYLRWR